MVPDTFFSIWFFAQAKSKIFTTQINHQLLPKNKTITTTTSVGCNAFWPMLQLRRALRWSVMISWGQNMANKPNQIKKSKRRTRKYHFYDCFFCWFFIDFQPKKKNLPNVLLAYVGLFVNLTPKCSALSFLCIVHCPMVCQLIKSCSNECVLCLEYQIVSRPSLIPDLQQLFSDTQLFSI